MCELGEIEASFFQFSNKGTPRRSFQGHMPVND